MLATGKHGYQNIRCALQHVRPTIAVQLLGFLKEITDNRLAAIRFCATQSGGRPMVAPTVLFDRLTDKSEFTAHRKPAQRRLRR